MQDPKSLLPVASSSVAHGDSTSHVHLKDQRRHCHSHLSPWVPLYHPDLDLQDSVEPTLAALWRKPLTTVTNLISLGLKDLPDPTEALALTVP